MAFFRAIGGAKPSLRYLQSAGTSGTGTGSANTSTYIDLPSGKWVVFADGRASSQNELYTTNYAVNISGSGVTPIQTYKTKWSVNPASTNGCLIADSKYAIVDGGQRITATFSTNTYSSYKAQCDVYLRAIQVG